MQFFVVDRGQGRRANSSYPYVVLQTDNWNDYGFNTLFHPTLYLSDTETVDLQSVKILRLEQASGPTPIEPIFESLDASYCSLGQSPSYYESLGKLPSAIRHEYLTALGDVVASPRKRTTFETEAGFGVSLLRETPAEQALVDGPRLFGDELSVEEEASVTEEFSVERFDPRGGRTAEVSTTAVEPLPAEASHWPERDQRLLSETSAAIARGSVAGLAPQVRDVRRRMGMILDTGQPEELLVLAEIAALALARIDAYLTDSDDSVTTSDRGVRMALVSLLEVGAEGAVTVAGASGHAYAAGGFWALQRIARFLKGRWSTAQ